MKFVALLAVVSTIVAALKPQAFHAYKGGAITFEQYLKDQNVEGSSLRTAAAASLGPESLPTISGFYKQQVDHFGNQKGINGSSYFNQLYYVQDAFYKPGGPIFFYIAGEGPADDYSLRGGSFSLISHLMPRYNGMAVTLEHRFYGAGADPKNPGRSVPTADLSPESLKLLTANQAIEDMASFITDFPSLFPEKKIPADTKWITIGGSYPGSLSAWMRQQHPELVYAAHASSAPVQLQLDFWRYSYAVDEGLKFWADITFKNGQACVNGWTRAMKVFDTTLTSILKNPTALKEFKKKFWLSQLVDINDFTSYVGQEFGGTVQYYPQSEKVGSVTKLEYVCNPNSTFVNPKASDADLLAALQAFSIAKLTATGITGDDDPTLKDYNSVPITDYSYSNNALIWFHQACNEFGYAQTAQPLKGGLIEGWSAYSQFINVNQYEWWCQKTGLSKKSAAKEINANNQYYGGLFVSNPNILWVNGQYDPWHWLSNFKSAPSPADQDVLVYKNATHCMDLWGPLDTTKYYPRVTPEYENEFFGKLFAVYDKWIHGK
ncbi:peptidase S28 [Obelidium mucronatum]|nr:peptidase S28 [Obelidium mucronatum]